MDEKDLRTVPYILYKIAEAKYKRIIFRLTLALVMSNLFFIILLISGR